MVRLINGLYPGAMISAPNIVEVENGEVINLYCHEVQVPGEAKVCYYYFSTSKDPPPKYPTNKNAMAWKEERVSKRTPGNRSYPVVLDGAPEAKNRKHLPCLSLWGRVR
jgi:hypothetical protein